MTDSVEQVLERARRYVKLETPTGDEEACRRMARLLAEDLGDAGARVRTLDAPGWGAHVLAEFDADADDAAQARPGDAESPSGPRTPHSAQRTSAVLVLGHFDTVHPVGTLARMPFTVEDDVVRGPGIYDMKGPIALIVQALHASRGRRRRPLRVLLTCDEEQGSTTSRALIEDVARDCDAVLVAEPPMPDGGAKTQRKGVGMYELRVRGRAAHAGIEPEAGASAIHAIARLITDAVALARPDVGTTINVGRVRGGTTGNVVADDALAELDVRYIEPAEGERVDSALRALSVDDERIAIEWSGGENRPPLVRAEGVLALYERVREHAAAAGFDLPHGATGGGSDGCFTAAIGVPTLDGLGLTGAGAHTDHEHVRLAPIAQRLDWWTRMLSDL